MPSIFPTYTKIEPVVSDEWELLDKLPDSNAQISTPAHDIFTAPLITRDAYTMAGYDGHPFQYGVLGRTLSVHNKAKVESPQDSRIYINTNAPFSAIVCGVQGSGKSHTVSVMLENMLIPNYVATGSLKKALSGLVLHFGEGGSSARPCEAAWLSVPCVSDIQTPVVRVFVSPSSLKTMKTVYAPLGEQVTVEPLFLTESELDAQAFLSIMAIESSNGAPLYIQIILSILRELGETYTFSKFMAVLKLRKESFSPAQLSGLEQRMSLLTAFLDKRSGAAQSQTPSRFAAGQLTIIDLSDPFIDPVSACGLFEIITRLFVRADVGTGKVIVIDEAHKYLSSAKASGLTAALLALMRQQRHLAMRVVISTQEPTVVPPVLLDLCTVSILHRFSSPAWWAHLIHHVSADFSEGDAFDRVVKLQTGQAIVLAPSSMALLEDKGDTGSKVVAQLGRRYLLIKSRKRITADGGASITVL